MLDQPTLLESKPTWIHITVRSREELKSIKRLLNNRKLWFIGERIIFARVNNPAKALDLAELLTKLNADFEVKQYD